ncbi:MAG: hypothetical protein D6691_10275 [Candidatus Hydrogenedentota bacterium]|jgi:Spy/CpxP family protein refolding chaperone|uniref:Uncharacterized protein n=1 Tax=Sumerlaea chitinivorans TaxID=2250252 RepID=A0A2Z4Y7N1_SUMC1|nr:hypothetical protein BRCON_1875 [Candidatus Sumerlaea chitinivorans]MCX7964304.1 hypothetical protein [Candidatus Sumerlaea chitinivorans]RMH25092.1 MAG: hypothetical protein D6691_10275 [Candidatus Hydrogenedentota bacterium]
MRPQQEAKDHSLAKLVISIVLIIAAGGYGFYRVNQVRPGAVANNGVTDEFQPPSPQQMQEMMKEAAAYANITPEQQKKLEELRDKMMKLREQMTTGPRQGGRFGDGPPPGMMMGGFGGFGGGRGDGGNPQMRELREEMQKVLSDDQRQKLREYFQQQRSKREAKVKAALGDAEYQRYLEKRRERFGNRGPGGRGGGGRPNQGQNSPQNPGQNPGGNSNAPTRGGN